MFTFLHIPKTGGVATSEAIQRVLPHTMLVRSPAELETFKAMRPKDVAKHSAICGHIPMGVDRLFQAHGVECEVTYATILRDPADRLLSAYYFVLSREDNPLHKQLKGMTFGEWAVQPENVEADNIIVRQFLDDPCPPPTISWAFAMEAGSINEIFMERAWENIQRVHFIGLYDKFFEFVRQLEKHLGHDLRLERKNVTPARAALEDTHPRILREIHERNRFDYEILKRVKKRLPNWKALSAENRGTLMRLA